MVDASICVPTRIENIQMAIPATDIHALAFRVDEHVVGIGAQLNVGNCSSISDGIRSQSCGISSTAKRSIMSRRAAGARELHDARAGDGMA